MQKLASTHPEFIKSFTSACAKEGFTAKQASLFLDAYIQAEAAMLSSDFNAGLKEEFQKSATKLKGLKQLGTGLKNLIMPKGGLLGDPNVVIPAAGAGLGYLADTMGGEGTAPDSWLGGGTIGAGLGAIAGLLSRKNKMKGIKAFTSELGNRISKGGVGRHLAGGALDLVGNKNMLKRTGQGVLGGLGLAAGSKMYSAGAYPDINPNTGIPWYLSDGSSAPGGYTPSFPSQEAGANNPFGLATDVEELEKYGPGGYRPTNAQTQQSGIRGPQLDAANAQSKLVGIDNQISGLQQQINAAGNTPGGYQQTAAIRAQLDSLKAQRGAIASQLEGYTNILNEDKQRMAEAADRMRRTGSAGLESGTEEFNNLRARIEAANKGGIWGGVMKGYNYLTDPERRMRELQPQYDAYQQMLDRANRIQQMAQ
jgi:hypothetical protein